MKALVLEKQKNLSVRDIVINTAMGPNDVKIALKCVGICGSDVHYYQHGRLGNFIVNKPMILGHEASGEIVKVGENVKHLKPGDRVCMEPGIPDPESKASHLGLYNLDPEVVFWATPPTHGVTREFVMHPANYTYKLPDNVSYEEGALIEPLAVGLHAVMKAEVKPGDIAYVIGAGTIGISTAIAALAGGCSKVFISDVLKPKLEITKKYKNLLPLYLNNNNAKNILREVTSNWGVDIIFEASGSGKAIESIFNHLCPGGKVVLIGSPGKKVQFDVVAAQVKEAKIITIFRYAHVFPRALTLIESGKVNLKHLITGVYDFKDSIKAYKSASENTNNIKIIININT